MESKFLIFVIVVLGVLAIIQLVRVYELAYKVRGVKSEEIVSPGENTVVAASFIVFMLAYFGFIIWLMFEYGNGGLGPAASEHGEKTDTLLVFNWWIILPVFFLCNTVLFVFAFIYRRNPNRKAVYFPHNNKLEMIWTVVPAMALSAIIIYGLKTWNFIMNPEDAEDRQVIELYAEQFSWTGRYAGGNNELGKADFKLITGKNPLGVITSDNITASYEKLDKEIHNLDSTLQSVTIETYEDNKKTKKYLIADVKVDELTEKLERLKRQKYRIQEGVEKGRNGEEADAIANDDVVVKGELHLVVNQPYTFYFRSKDVIHSAWFPHFRAQMNCVPGMTTSFSFTPTKTTKEMREDEFIKTHYQNINKIHNERKKSIGEPEELVEFDFVLMCNKICGGGHSNMQMKVIVETEEEFKEWIESQKQLDGGSVKYWGSNAAVETEAEEEVAKL